MKRDFQMKQEAQNEIQVVLGCTRSKSFMSPEIDTRLVKI